MVNSKKIANFKSIKIGNFILTNLIMFIISMNLRKKKSLVLYRGREWSLFNEKKQKKTAQNSTLEYEKERKTRYGRKISA
jgi:hypothetical protein